MLDVEQTSEKWRVGSRPRSLPPFAIHRKAPGDARSGGVGFEVWRRDEPHHMMGRPDELVGHIHRGEELQSWEELAEKAAEQLDVHPHFHGRSPWIHVYVGDHCLRLAGIVPSFYLKQLAQEIVRQAVGHRALVNEIKVVSRHAEIG